MSYLGDFKASSTVNFVFTTTGGTGSPIAPLSAFEAADLVIYKDNSATQRSSAAGITMTSPFDSVVGLHQVSIDTSDNTDSGFWAAGHDYFVVLSPDTETVDGLTVLAVVSEFSIENRCVNWGKVAAPTTALALTGTTLSAALVAASVTAGVGLADGAITAAKIAADAIGASELAADAVTEIVTAVWAAAVRSLSTAPPTVAEINQELTASHGVGDWNGSGGGDDAETIAAEVDSVLTEAHGSGAWGDGSEQEVGDGSVTFLYTVFDSDGTTPLEGVSVYVSSDSDGDTRSIARITDDLGSVVFRLNPGTYYFWRTRPDKEFTDPDTEVVS